MEMIDWYKRALIENYGNFSGRARRSEYWYFTLCNIIIVFILMIPMVAGVFVAEIMGVNPGIFVFISVGLVILYYIATLIPTLAVTVRRLHDTGKSGWMYLLSLVPFGSLVLLFFCCEDSQSGSNKWGENPKEIFGNIREIGNPQT